MQQVRLLDGVQLLVLVLVLVPGRLRKRLA